MMVVLLGKLMSPPIKIIIARIAASPRYLMRPDSYNSQSLEPPSDHLPVYYPRTTQVEVIAKYRYYPLLVVRPVRSLQSN